MRRVWTDVFGMTLLGTSNPALRASVCTCVCDFHGCCYLNALSGLPAIFSPFSLMHRAVFLVVFAPPKISPLPLPLTLAPVWRFSPLLSILPVLSSPSPPVCCHPSSPSHRYLTPRHKAEFCDVTKWVEDVNRNTQGPFLRYNLRLHPFPPHSSPH